MDSERLLFEKGCFLPIWAEDVVEEQKTTPVAYNQKSKDLQTLLSELADIKKHLEDVRERQWKLAKMLDFHNHNLAKE